MIRVRTQKNAGQPPGVFYLRPDFAGLVREMYNISRSAVRRGPDPARVGGINEDP